MIIKKKLKLFYQIHEAKGFTLKNLGLNVTEHVLICKVYKILLRKPSLQSKICIFYSFALCVRACAFYYVLFLLI